ncbi:hypothetical protein P168DRAFT_236040 [Aspergillus campestris IBT 28561]|uniref:Uncharacterized protein n=1 Tax=Aspergillus campestris (strain IBT 28561) TaxID=1392248 RepID=A0A2I1D3I5_ASPC2|nr:uncharacterized protein P168DRAFT_236040 [Aspergillus campestris IBT 28561]PKY04434.1 hypothetical protein P168DRAFT_236040 [Aspergillus campestris IBT 28561]
MEGLFSKHAEKILRKIFRKDLLEQLPAEILLRICEVMGPCWYLTVLGETQRLMGALEGKREPQQNSLNLDQTRTVWISRITYHGVSYVSRLRDKPLRFTELSDQIQLRIPRRISKIVASVDGIGVRGIKFLEHTADAPLLDKSPWYEVLPVRDTDQKIFVNSNSLFIKRIQLERELRGVPYIWSTPCPPTVPLTSFYRASRKSLGNVRVHYIKFDPHVRGLLACCTQYGLVGIHGLTDTSTTFRAFVDLMYRRRPESHKHWMYFPFNPQESIIAAWVRRLVFGNHGNCPPLLLTSRGRTITFGPQLPSDVYGPYRYELLGGIRDGPISGIFHDGLNLAPNFELDESIGSYYNHDANYIKDIGVTCDNESSVEARKTLPANIHMDPPTFAPDGDRLAGTWYMTSASLCNIAKAQICRDTDQSHRPCLGLLLYYDDGHMEAIGQIRWDRDVSEEVDRPTYIVNAVIDGKNYIKDVLNRVYGSELTRGESTWQNLPASGTIRWWFSERGDQIRID